MTMNEPQRTVLQTQIRNIAKDIIMSEDLLSSLYEKNIFEPHMIELIKAERTSTEKAYKMLELLPKRGPAAFHGFLDIIQHDYPWLAVSLESRCRSEMERYSSREVKHKVSSDSHQLEGKKSDSDNSGSDIRKKVSTFVHKYFGHSKKLAEKDKKLIVNWMTNQITDVKMRLQSVSASEHSHSDKDSNESDEFSASNVKEELFKLHLKLEPYLIRQEVDATDEVNLNTYLPDDMTFQILNDEVDQICVNLSYLQDEIDSTLDQFDSCVRDNGLKVLVESLILKYNNQGEQLDKEGKRNTELIDDLSDYSEQIHKLETERAKMRYQIDLMHKDLSHSRHEKFQVQEHCKHLNTINKENEKEIENLQTLIRELQAPKLKKDSTFRTEASRSPVRKSRNPMSRSLNLNIPMFSRRSNQYYHTNSTRTPSQKRPP